LNEKYPRETAESISWNKDLMNLVSEEEVKGVVRVMKKKKVVGLDGVPT